MPEISRLTRPKPQTISLDMGDGDTVRIAFDANKVTPRWMNQTMQGAEQTDLLVLAKALAEVLIEWDVTDGGQAWAPTTDHIAELSFPAVNRLFEEVCSSAAPSDAEGNASSPSANEPQSASAETSETSPNGSDGSISPQPSDSAFVT